MRPRYVVLVAGLLLALNTVHGLWHIDNALSGWQTNSPWTSWANSCLGIGQLDCHTAVVLAGEFVLSFWLGYWYWRAVRKPKLSSVEVLGRLLEHR